MNTGTMRTSSQYSYHNYYNNNYNNNYMCPVCFDTLLPPIFQCYEGHLLCNNCIDKLERKCPVCRGKLPSRKIKALEIEKIVRRSLFTCKFREFGCQLVMTLDSIKEHELDCQFALSVSFCEYLGIQGNCKKRIAFKDLASHLTTTHQVEIGTSNYKLGQIIEVSQELGHHERSFPARSPDGTYLSMYVIQAEDAIFFLKTEVAATEKYFFRWSVLAIGRGNVSRKYNASISLLSAQDPNHSLTWEGRVLSIFTKREDLLSKCFLYLNREYLDGLEPPDLNYRWKLSLKITRKPEESWQLFQIVFCIAVAIICVYKLLSSIFPI